MQRNYYNDLEINRDATQSMIAHAYCKLSLKYHPKYNSENPYLTYKNFCLVSEAYQVLSDPIKRSFYDKYGEFKLKEGFFSQQSNKKIYNIKTYILFFQQKQKRLESQLQNKQKNITKKQKKKGGYIFEGNPEEIFEKFFGTGNPFKQTYDTTNKQDIGELFRYPFAHLNKNLSMPKDLHVEIECTLNELYNGCIKEITYKRTVFIYVIIYIYVFQILNKDGITTKEITEIKKIEIKPGFYNGQKIVYQGLGHQEPGVENSNLVITIKELPHKNIKRVQNDFIYLHKINLIDALSAKFVEFITFDKRTILIPMDQVINPQTVKMVEGEGMPIYNSEEFKVENFNQQAQKGDLFIKFDIEIPKIINEEKKEQFEILLEEMQN
ncbi:hypothetical protein IMG5_059990 [Ichthyophthirius multifiliis]|uniref:J domain-containing protein n=1 Tax=Ichthyophthirius multifiliis TaxID=5932 RepID=G0QNM4_ICHMU|nr:hypothetical protein IMG5_059990 [Ichthyophthirius multifiliis]EGR33185.1 hypothetical protein IMG5_059990 [Ichthyophthirius multifiliis]|eukprot:XP_004037171.1 hypothetical protein IMG5_059990 [Ichthyophthirius multifiliis]